MYRHVVRPVLFRLDPELSHDIVLALGRQVSRTPLLRAFSHLYECNDDRLRLNVFGLDFASPLGVAAGLDKNCRIVELLAALGFNHIELGTVTRQPQPGNPRPRIFRLIEDRALINRMGFPSDGAEVVAKRLELLLERLKSRPVIGVNMGKTKSVALDDALADYLATFERFSNLGDYFVLNVSSPNTPELRKLQEPGRLAELFSGIAERNSLRRPVLVKVAPDLSFSELDAVLDCCLQHRINGIVATNTTFSRSGLMKISPEGGGLSGPPLFPKTLEFVRHIHQATRGKLSIVGVGGVGSGQDVYQLIRAGASLVQIYTALVYEGPHLIHAIKRELLEKMDRDGVKSVREWSGQT